jgi:hydrogenase/urease accessory protein HupE
MSSSRSTRGLVRPRRADVRLAATALAALAWLAVPRRAAAHDFSPGVLALVETTPGGFDVAWTAPVDSAGTPAGVDLVFPAQCQRDGARLECGQAGFHGVIAFEKMHERRTQIVVVIRRLDGTSQEDLVTGAAPQLTIERRPDGAALTWLKLGIEHILGGFDHLAFVIGLLLVVKLDRRLLATVTAFTLAHSLTLALATLDLVRLPSAPVEATIAASVLLLAREATHEEPTATRRFPWAVALLFGLVHGLGFAGALRSLGLPSGSVGWALLWFNLGVEAGQLGVIAVVVLGLRLGGRRLARLTWARTLACYLIGAPAAWWLIERTLVILQGR